MTNQWFLEDIENLIKKRGRVVILDPRSQYGFLLPLLEFQGYTLLRTDSNLTEPWQTVKEELLLRYEAETRHKSDKVVFYVSREQDKLSFLLDYCFTHGCLDFSEPAKWLRKKLFSHTGLQVQLDDATLLTAGKIGAEKDLAWWKKILQNLEDLIDLEDELIPFMDDPEAYIADLEQDIRRMFETKVFQLLNQPYMTKPTKTLAEEVARKLLDGLAYNDIKTDLLSIYHRWADSETYSPSLMNYVANYNLDSSVDPWAAHPDHCFSALDQKALQQLTGHLRDKEYVSGKLDAIKARAKNTRVKRFVPGWWQDFIILMEFDNQPLTACSSFEQVVDFYTSHFAQVDRAIRNLYTAFLSDKSIIRPLQEYYESLNYELLQKWFEYAQQYKSDQQGYLPDLFKNAKAGTAVIVGDGIRYEIADYVATTLANKFKVDKQIMLAGLPSETEHNMSALYVGNNEVLASHKDREKKLGEISGKAITYMNLEAVSYGEKANYLVLNYKDIDYAGETLQQGALKLFTEFEQVLQDKIAQLLNMGYKEVHLVTDHGFVLTGLLDEADKIAPDAGKDKEVHERFIRTQDKPDNPDWLVFEKPYGEYKYLCAAKSHRPFKSKGAYGFAHGGFTPQEIILPRFVFRKDGFATSSLGVAISNKTELAEVAGEIFVVKLQADAGATDLFAFKRKVKILLYDDNINCGSSNLINMEPGKTETIEFTFDDRQTLKAVLLDAESQEQLDIVSVKKANIRDLGGLL
ncbi:PglZ domain-containing protein [Syntrophomonas wolfei]|uniref:PglZ domain-containing protein n=1 Tax=Syntrophomonas wolfei subsp. wolfei (strain DSM 2245B / Goettingen) TaxID=335541 RepID=Q0AY92_SYNWW|nr:PglZ domain-containing protein [Syntrophomonas wolfei]ABI68312.1 hypothetical protein Swol_0998 [Syntrophomonas wolfei subsp. wolfei str. Goettingen G311]